MLLIILVVMFFVVLLGYMGDEVDSGFFVGWLATSAVVFTLCLPVSRYVSGDAMSKLSVDYKINLQNHKILMETLNDRAKFENQLSGAIVDAPNMGQAQRASEAVSIYVEKINTFNEDLRSAQYNRSITPVLRFMWFGLLAPIPDGVDFIILN